jgi:hypothetical protein|tara:strand:- start:161 stop:1036 length:876 start_codon:yes stop_codon:yes gene_type:complete
MDTIKITNACNILHISNSYTEDELKQAYRKLALKYHPDKCEDKSGERFKEINSAYIFLSKIKSDSNDSSYSSLLRNFVKYINKNIDSEILLDIIEKKHKYTYEILKNCNKETCINIYELIMKYKDIFGIDKEILDIIKDIVREKTINDNVVILNPTLKDLFYANCYVLEYTSSKIYVPLWHSELIYELKDGSDLIVKCIPDISNHYSIDENNNIHIYLKHSTTLQDLLSRDKIVYNIVENINIDIYISDLFIRKHQIIKYSNIGIPKITTNNVYNVENKGDIIIYLDLEYK